MKEIYTGRNLSIIKLQSSRYSFPNAACIGSGLLALVELENKRGFNDILDMQSPLGRNEKKNMNASQRSLGLTAAVAKRQRDCLIKNIQVDNFFCSLMSGHKIVCKIS